MLALRLYGANDIRLVDIPVPEINDDEILLKTQAAALCGTDIRMWKNGKDGVDADHPLTLGHEFAGVIEKVGKNVPFYQKGMRVTLQPNICGQHIAKGVLRVMITVITPLPSRITV